MSLTTNEDIFKFLEYYQNESIIWNPKHVHHKDKKKVNDAWVRISNELEIPIAQLKKRKETLMATFRQHLKKKKASISSGCGQEDVYHPIWVFYDIMESFLGNVYECSSKINTQTQEITQVSSLNQETEAKQENEQEEHQRHSNVTTIQDRVPSPWNRTVLKRRSSNPLEIQKASEQMQNALDTLNAVLMNKASQREDICDQYGRLLASKLRKYFSDIEQQEVMFELDELVAKRIRNRPYEQRFTPSPSAMSCGSVASTSTAEMHRPSSSQTFYVSPNSPISVSQHPYSSHSRYSIPVINIPEKTKTVTQNMIISSPQHQQVLHTTLDQPRNQIRILSDEIIDSVHLNPILNEAYFKAIGDDNS